MAVLLRAALTAALRPPAAAASRHHPLGAVVGLDVSTRNVGLAVLCSDGALLRSEVLSAGAGDDVYAFGKRVADAVAAAHATSPLVRVGVEDIMKTFSPGRFHTQGLFKLARLNGIVSYGAWAATGCGAVPLELAMPNEVRGYFGLRAAAAAAAGGGRGSSDELQALGGEAAAFTPSDAVLSGGGGSGAAAIKLAVMHFVGGAYPGLAGSWETTRTGSWKATNYDRADAVLMALFTLARHHEEALLRDGRLFEALAREYVIAHTPTASPSRALTARGKPKKPRGKAAAAVAAAVPEDGDALGALLPALLRLHGERLAAAAPGGAASGDAASREHPPPVADSPAAAGSPARRRRGGVRAVAGADGTVGAAGGRVSTSLDPTRVAAVYDALRTDVAAQLRDVLLGRDGGAPLLWAS